MSENPRREKILTELKERFYSGKPRGRRKYHVLIRDVLRDIVQYRTPHCRRLLDVGSGPGNLLDMLMDTIATSCSFFGADIDTDMIGLMRETAERRNHRINFIINDNQGLPFKTHTFDLVVSVLAMHHFKYPVKMIQEMNRTVGPGGKVVVYDFNPRNIKLRIYCLVLKAYNLFAKSCSIRGLVESVGSAYTTNEIADLVQTAGIEKYRIYQVNFFNVLAIEK